MTIKPHQGYGEVLLGTSRSKIIEQLGEPDERNTESYTDGINIEYYVFSSPRITLGFDDSDGDRLGTITVCDEDALYNGHRIIGRLIEDVVRENNTIVLEDDFEESGMDYFDQSNHLSFWVNDGKVTNVTVFPDWVDDDTPRWPSTTKSEQPAHGDADESV